MQDCKQTKFRASTFPVHMLSESQSASRKQEWAEANALAELSTEAVAKALAVVTETKLENVHRLLG